MTSSNAYNQNRPDMVIMALTSLSLGSGYFGNVGIQNWQQTGLCKPSVIKPILPPLEKDLIIKKSGSITDNDRAALNEGLQSILGK